ncbi:MAG: hypothetical protein AAGG02_16995 [Cyanobacteria bacterium P01_H01_bin.15]
MAFPERYLEGEYEEFWLELQQLNYINNESLEADAMSVAREAMRRVRINIKGTRTALFRICQHDKPLAAGGAGRWVANFRAK